MEKWEISREVQYFKNRLDIREDVIELDQKIERIALLEAKMAEPGFWDDAAKASGIIQECNNLKTRWNPSGKSISHTKNYT